MSKHDLDSCGDDYKLTQLLQNAMQANDNSYSSNVKTWLRKSPDEVFRSVCLEYLAFCDLLDENDVILGLRDNEFIVRSTALDYAEKFPSNLITTELVRLLYEESDDFIVAWALVELSINEYEDQKLLVAIKNKWAESQIVQASVLFHRVYVYSEIEYLGKFLHFIKSDDHLTRALIVNLSLCLSNLENDSKIISVLENALASEPMESLKEAISGSLVELKS